MIDERAAKLWARNGGYKRRLEKTKEHIKQCLKTCPNNYVSCSFGKDSTVLLHLVLQEKKDVQARFISWPETKYIDNYDEVIKEWESLGVDILELKLTRETLDEKVKDRWLKLAKNASGSFVGLRASESKGRRITLRANGTIYKNKKGFYRLCPLAWWQDMDIAAYVVENSLPTLNTYKKKGFGSRTSSRIPRSDFFIREEYLNNLKINNPTAFFAIKNIYPEVDNYV